MPAGAATPRRSAICAASAFAWIGSLPPCAALIGLLLSQPLAAVSIVEQQHIDPLTSTAGFEVRVAWVRNLPGRFDHVEGVISRQPQHATFSVDVRLAAQSLSMANPDYAAWAQSEEFFDTLRHPWIRFLADDVPLALLSDGGTLTGMLSLRGITRPVSLEVEPASCARPGIDCVVEAQGELKRSEFGMQGRRIVVADKVRLNLAIRARADQTQP